MNAGGSKSLKVVSLLVSGILLAGATQLAFTAPATGGKIVWWGKKFSAWGEYGRRTNGAIEMDGEVVSNIVAIATDPTGAQLLALRNDGSVLTQLLDGYLRTNFPPELTNVAYVGRMENSSWATRRDGRVIGWSLGSDDSGELLGLRNVTGIVALDVNNYLALRNDGTVFGFTVDDHGTQDPATGLPVATFGFRLPLLPNAVKPVTINGKQLSNIVSLLSTNSDPTGSNPLALTKDGTVLCLGCDPVPERTFKSIEEENRFAQGLGDERAHFNFLSANPLLVNGQALTNIAGFASGNGYVLALRRDGTVISWRSAYHGDASVPEGLANVIAICAANHTRLALKSDGTVVAWGEDSPGQSIAPAGLSNVVAIAVGRMMSFAVTTGDIPSSVFIKSRKVVTDQKQP